jgi:peptidoglycan/LPS O-acetylase OafA/YrhL
MPGVDPSPAAVVRPASIPELDGARAVAALGVFIFHAATAATPLNKHVFTPAAWP